MDRVSECIMCVRVGVRVRVRVRVLYEGLEPRER